MRLAKAQLSRFVEAVRPQFGQVDGRPQGKQALVGADIARGLFAANVLLASLQGEHPAAAAAAIDRLTGNSPWQSADELLLASHDPQVWAAVQQRRAE